MKIEKLKTISGLFLSIAGLSLFVFFATPQSFSCRTNTVSAQDNPCLAQESTLTAMEFELFQANSTIEALEHQLATISATDETELSSQRILFEDTFDDNSTGWNIFSQPNGRAIIEDGKLKITANACEFIWLNVPDLELPSEYYLEVEMISGETITSGHSSVAGFGIGNANLNTFHSFSISHDEYIPAESLITLRDHTQSEPDFSTQYDDDIFSPERGTLLGLESRGGIFTVYINGQARDTTPVNLYGNNVGLYVLSGAAVSCLNADVLEVIFDNFVIRPAR